MTSGKHVFLLVAAATLVAVSAITLAAGRAARAQAAQEAAQEAAQLTILAPEEEVKQSVKEFVVPVEIAGVQNLGAFLFVMTYDSNVVTVKEVRQGPFLGSSGREVNCDPPVLQEGQVRYFCVTLRPVPEGADGGGVLAEVVFEPAEGGTTQLEITRAQITDPGGKVLEVGISAATLEVEKESSFALIWLIAIGIAGGVVLLVLFEAGRRFIKGRRAPAEAV